MIARSEDFSRPMLQRLHDNLPLGDDSAAELAEENLFSAGQDLRCLLDHFAATGARWDERYRRSSVGRNPLEAGAICGREDDVIGAPPAPPEETASGAQRLWTTTCDGHFSQFVAGAESYPTPVR